MSKNMQLPEEFIKDVTQLTTLLECDEVAELLKTLQNKEISEKIQSLRESIDKVLLDKYERLERRNAYTNYKTANYGESREEKKQKYINLK